MLHSIINSAKAELGEIQSKNGLTEDQIDQILNLAKDAVLNCSSASAGRGDWNSIMELFTGSQSIKDSDLANNIIGDCAGQIMVKVGLSPALSRSIANIVIPTILNLINSKTTKSGSSSNRIVGNNIHGAEKKDLFSHIVKIF